MLTREQQREILALGLLALSVFLVLALFPVILLGPDQAGVFPSGNVMGMVGRVVGDGLTAALGGAAWLVPVLLLVAGVRAGEWLSPSWSLRLAILVVGLLLLLPPAFEAVGLGPEISGWLGGSATPYLVTAFGVVGAILLLALALIMLSVATLGWNPLRSLLRGMAQGTGLVGRTLRAVGDRVGAWREESRGRRERRGRSGRRHQALARGGDEPAGEPAVPAAAAAAAGSAAPEATEGSASSPAGAAGARAGEEPGLGTARGLTARPDELPTLDLLSPPETADRAGMERELDRLGEVLVEKLRTFNVESRITGRTTGPVVTQFEVVPAPGVKVNKIANLDADLALAMRAQSIRIVAPIPGKGAVGVEIPNPEPEVVQLREILEAPAYQNARARLPLALGKDLTGRPYVSDLGRMPHILIAGATGSGKSVCLNTIITSLVYRHTPETLRFLLIDPKMVELSTYADLPHLRHPVVTDPRDAAGVLRWAVLEMERRYGLLSANGVRSLEEFNERVREGETVRRAEPAPPGARRAEGGGSGEGAGSVNGRGGAVDSADGALGDENRWIYDDGVLPHVVVVVDELADLMMTVQSEIEKPLTHLAQKARAIGIHLIVATQRPSVNVITGLIKANFPSRVAFRVASKTDSRTILDQNGADALLGNGDMLFLPPGQSEPVRIQGAFVGTEETDRLMAWFRAQAAHRAEALEEAGQDPEAVGPTGREEGDILDMVRAKEMEDAAAEALAPDDPEDWDEYFRAAAEVCITHDQGSTSLLQRKLRVGYGRAARIVDQLHEAGILGPPDGSRPREVLANLDELDAICSAHGLSTSE